MTPRFDRHALNYLPVDLNALLYKYETDFAYTERIFGDRAESEKWDMLAQKRKKVMDKLMWDRTRGLYYDYNFVKDKRSSINSLAAYFPMWAGMSFSADPSVTFLTKLMTWLRQEIHPQVLLTVGLQPTIGAGCILRTTNRYFDFSLRQDFANKRTMRWIRLSCCRAKWPSRAFGRPSTLI